MDRNSVVSLEKHAWHFLQLATMFGKDFKTFRDAPFVYTDIVTIDTWLHAPLASAKT